MTRRILLGTFLGVVLVAAPAWAGLWEWTDGGGNVRKARTLEDIPEEFRSTASEVPSIPAAPEAVPLEQQVPSTPGTAPAAKPAPARPTAPAAPAPRRPDDSASGSAAAATDRQGHDREWWKGQVVDARQQVLDAQKKLDELRAQRAREAVVRKERQVRKEVADAEAELAKARKALDEDLPKAAREAGAPRWWLDVK